MNDNNTAKVTACPSCIKSIEACDRGSLEYSQWKCNECHEVRLREEYRELAEGWSWDLSPAGVARVIRDEDMDEDLALEVVEEVFGPDARWHVEDTLDVL